MLPFPEEIVEGGYAISGGLAMNWFIPNSGIKMPVAPVSAVDLRAGQSGAQAHAIQTLARH